MVMDYMYNAVVMGKGYLLINLSHLHLRSLRDMQDNYVSVHWDDRFYFSNAYHSSQAQNYSITLNHNIVLPLNDSPTLTLPLQAWENHMIMFQHEVDLAELKTRSATRKKLEIRQGEILDFTVHLLQEHEFHLSPLPNPQLIQHFLIVHTLTLHDLDTSNDHGPSYLALQHDAGTIILPVINAVAVVSLPSRLKFKHFKNGKMRSYSRHYEVEEVVEGGKVRMVAGEDVGYDLEVGMLWGINLWHNHPERSMLLEAQEVLVYEIEIRLQGWKDLPPGLKVKLNYGNKSFELCSQINEFTVRLARIVYFVMKSEEEDFCFVLEKNIRTVGKVVIGSQELLSYHLNTLKRKIVDPNGKQMASIRFRSEKGKNLSLPQTNPSWKNYSSKGKKPAIMLEFSQLSIEWSLRQSCGLIIKSEEEELFVPQLTNFSFFQLQTQIPEPVVLTLHQQGNVYLKLVDSANKDSYLGIAALNFADLRLGVNVLTLPFFKQQQAACLLHLIVNKIVPWPFIRGLNIPQGIYGSSPRLIGISVQIKRIQLSGYYYSYQYDRKNELYCIVEINRIKKVLILEPFHSLTKALLFVNSPNSDLLNFTTDHADSAKIKFTLLVTDDGCEEEVFGSLQKKVGVEKLKEGPVKFDQQEVANDHGIAVGVMDFEVQLGLTGEYKQPIKKDLKNVQNSLEKVNKSIEKVERSRSKNNLPTPAQPKKRYQSLVLPSIKDPRQERLKRLANMLQMKQKEREKRKARRVQSERIPNIKEKEDLFIPHNYTSIEETQQQMEGFNENEGVKESKVEIKEVESENQFNQMPNSQFLQTIQQHQP